MSRVANMAVAEMHIRDWAVENIRGMALSGAEIVALWPVMLAEMSDLARDAENAVPADTHNTEIEELEDAIRDAQEEAEDLRYDAKMLTLKVAAFEDFLFRLEKNPAEVMSMIEHVKAVYFDGPAR